MWRSVLAVVLGLVLAVVVIFGLEWVGQFVYPLPEGVNPNDTEALKKVLPNMPLGAFLLVLLGYAAGSLAGGFLAAWVARRGPATCALIVGAILMGMGALDLLTLPHPAWFWAASLCVYLPPAYAGSMLARRRPSAPLEPPTESTAT